MGRSSYILVNVIQVIYVITILALLLYFDLVSTTRQLRVKQRHDREVIARSNYWTPAIAEERRYVAVISCLLNYEVANIVTTDNLDLNSSSSCPLDFVENINRQAAHAYHSLYRGKSDEIVVKQSGDRSLTGRIGVITQFTSQHGRSDDGFIVRLSTDHVKLPSRYCGYKCVVDPKFLEPKSFSCSSSTSRSNFHPVVIMYMNTGGDVKHISFLIRRDIVDLVLKSIPADSEPSQSHISMFMISIGNNFQGLDLLRLNEHPASTTNLPVSPSLFPSRYDTEVSFDVTRSVRRCSYFLKNQLFKYVVSPLKTSLRISVNMDNISFSLKHPRCLHKEPILVQCPCHQSLTCQFRDMCGICCKTDENVEQTNDINQKLGYDLDLIASPNSTVLSFPFTTMESSTPSAALYLNEFNLHHGRCSTIPEATLMSRLARFSPSITNRDIFSMYPQNNISASVFNVLSGW